MGGPEGLAEVNQRLCLERYCDKVVGNAIHSRASPIAARIKLSSRVLPGSLQRKNAAHCKHIGRLVFV